MEISDGPDIILDSSVWITFLRGDDSQHKKATHLLRDLRYVAMVVPEYVLIEVATALKSKGYEDVAKKFVAEVIREGFHTFLPAGELATNTAALFLQQHSDHLSFTDTALLVLSEHYRVITFDKRLQKAIDRARSS